VKSTDALIALVEESAHERGPIRRRAKA
jgi:hypothetical protein